VPNDPTQASFEDFVRWLGQSNRDAEAEMAEPPPQILAAARAAHEAFRALSQAQRQELARRAHSGKYYEEVELMAAADANRERWLPRLRTPNGFAISALYPGDSAPGTAPVGLLVECPEDLIEVFRGLTVSILAGGKWVELGEIDLDGKTTGDLPAGIEFKPPFGFRVGAIEEDPEELHNPDAPR
jgi:hypothetical protein